MSENEEKTLSHDQMTREIYEKQHSRVVSNDGARNRIFSVYSDSTFGLDPKWFEGKVAIDAGCGNIGALMVQLARLGCKKVYGLDIGSDWIELLQKQLTEFQIPESKYELVPGTVCDLPFGEEYFDFVAINGVLIHLEDTDAIKRGFAEGARICKRGGHYFTSYGPCGGLMEGAIMPAVRQYYRKNPDFKAFIDNIRPQVIHAAIDKICADAKKHTGDNLDGNSLKSLFGEDFCVFLQNFIQPPAFWSNECTPDFVEGLYKKHGFSEITRLNEYVRRNDVRKLFAPLHYDRNYSLSKILYGEGYVKYIAKKI